MRLPNGALDTKTNVQLLSTQYRFLSAAMQTAHDEFVRREWADLADELERLREQVTDLREALEAK